MLTVIKAHWIKVSLLVVLVLVSVGAYIGWYKLLREVPQPEFVNSEMRFKYGSIGGENEAGIPYWIFYVLPRMFPEYLPGPGGYASLGLPWEQGQELPIGFTKKTIGFPRVGNNCAVCHTASYRKTERDTPTFAPAGPSQTSNVQGYFRFLIACANDPRFNAGNLLQEITAVYDLSWLDKLLYRFLIIPFTKQRLIELGEDLAWMERDGFPDWGHGRDDSMNLPKYVLVRLPWDDSFGAADFPSIWSLGQDNGARAFSWDGSTTSLRTFIIDSAIGVGARPSRDFLDHMQWLEEYLRTVEPPEYPFDVDQELAATGKRVFGKHCASCHAGARAGSVIPIDEIGTDRNRLDTWTVEAAVGMNKAVAAMGIEREDVIKTNGYVAMPLDGVWLRAPYLHNGSVPSLRALLEPEKKRPKLFFSGYDVHDPTHVGFVTQGEEAERVGFRYDATLKGNGNKGHRYGTELSPQEKNALIEYMKTL